MIKRQMDRGTLLGVLVAAFGVVAGLLLDGGTVTQIVQPTAALIVLGGTLGAVLIQFPIGVVLETVRQLRHSLIDSSASGSEVMEQLVGYCTQVRRHGILTLDAQLDAIENDFLRRALTLAVDGLPVRELREVMEVDLYHDEEREESVPKVLKAAGGFAPTLGIVGAVLGLIQVMQRMNDIGGIGKGIAVAFVSTLYGIGLANLFSLPLAGKLRIRIRERQIVREMTLDAVVAIVEGISARALKLRFEPYLIKRFAKAQPAPEQEMAIP